MSVTEKFVKGSIHTILDVLNESPDLPNQAALVALMNAAMVLIEVNIKIVNNDFSHLRKIDAKQSVFRTTLPDQPEPLKPTADLTDAEFQEARRRVSSNHIEQPLVKYKRANPNTICPDCQGTYESHPEDFVHTVAGLPPLKIVCCESDLISC